jgi:hypothetical protein
MRLLSSESVHTGFACGDTFAEAFGPLLLVGDVAQAFCKGSDLAEPPHALCFVESGVVFDFLKPW